RSIIPSRPSHHRLDHVLSRLAAFLLQTHPSVHDPRQALLAVTDDEKIDKRSEYLRILRARPAADDQGIGQGPILAMQRDAAQIEHRQQVRVADFVLKTETDQVKILQWSEGFQAIERQAVLPQLGFE